ncbi:unnamed protein product [Rhizoctonia solani]|uniref:MYND-type domain-containing protein n=1 Tax=Rhizoctonia solani TaxID=456999 RepID=A0A8H2XQ33_9AGAM|nr:unnamed protein product [Rhizoctonia solani]
MDSRASSPTESAGSDLEPHELWGEHKRPYLFMMHYMKLFGGHEGDWEPGSTEELDRCISMVRNNKARVSVSELETILRSARTWRLFEHFTCDSLDLIPHFMELLRSYCEENWIFDRYYGFLCFQLLTNVMIAGIINNSDKREHIFKLIRMWNAGSSDIASGVGGYGAEMMMEAIMSESHEEMFSTFFVADYQEGKYVLLPRLGGFREKDALWLLDELWEYRRNFVTVCAAVSKMRPGWAVLFTAIWRYVKKAQDSTILFKKLRNLLLRYALSAVEPELTLVCKIVSEIDEQVPSSVTEGEDLPPVDKGDVEFMVHLFMEYLDSEKHDQPSGDMMCFPFALVYHNALTTIPDQVPPLLAAVIECVWKTLGETDSRKTLRERMVEVFGYAVHIIMSMWASSVLIQGEHLEESKRVAVIVWTKLLRDVNMLELVGRLCSIAVVSSGEGLLISHEQFEDLTQSTRHFMDSLKSVTKINELGNLDDLRHTWDRVLRYIDLQLYVCPPGGLVRNRIRVCRSIWIDVGAVFKFKPNASQQHQCMNPRCPDPFTDGGARCVCMRCCWVHYCSGRCQSMHWNSTYVGAHRGECLRLGVQS